MDLSHVLEGVNPQPPMAGHPAAAAPLINDTPSVETMVNYRSSSVQRDFSVFERQHNAGAGDSIQLKCSKHSPKSAGKNGHVLRRTCPFLLL
jgi:hypothetical protein